MIRQPTEAGSGSWPVRLRRPRCCTGLMAPQMATRAPRASRPSTASGMSPPTLSSRRPSRPAPPAAALGVRRLVVDGGVEAELLDSVPALLGSAGDADHSAARDLRDLSDRAAHGARRTGDTTVSPDLAAPTSSSPKYAVMPGMPACRDSRAVAPELLT